jgi:transcriptional regulator with XRE-family HTH domain
LTRPFQHRGNPPNRCGLSWYHRHHLRRAKTTQKAADKRREELADFLKTRRARLTPAEVGLPDGAGRRRTPGLRREEVAMLAGVSTVWYTWLEQGRDVRPSPQVLGSVAGALRLDADERAHLFALAESGTHPLVPREEKVGPALRRALDALNPNPAYVMGRRWDKLAWNGAMTAVFGDFGALPPKERNTVWRMFTNGRLRETMPDWEGHARHVLAQFRASWGRHAGDPDFVELIEALKEASPEFREWWPMHDVQGSPEGRKELDHPVVGRMVLEHTTFQLHDDPDLKLVLFTPLTEADSAEKLRELLSGADLPRTPEPADAV